MTGQGVCSPASGPTRACWPGTDWIAGAPPPDQPAGAPLAAIWANCGTITHVFTHFRLELTVFAADVAAGTPAPQGMFWLEAGEITGAAFPNVMRKVLARAGEGAAE